MRIFVSYSHKDERIVKKISTRLEVEGHDVWIDHNNIHPGDNIQNKIEEGLKSVDALVVVVSKNSFRSAWVQREFSAIALQQLSKQERRVIPIKIDSSDVPSYLASRQYLDLSEDFEEGLNRLVSALNQATPESLSVRGDAAPLIREERSDQIANLRDALRQGRLTLVCGAGTSVEAGIPAWGALLAKLLDKMMKRISQDYSLDVGQRTAEQFKKMHDGASTLILGKYLRNILGNDFQAETRNVIYASEPTSSNMVDAIVELSRPKRDGRPLDSIITFNFDSLIDENLSQSNIQNRPIFSESINHDPHEIPIYHVHGYLPRNGPVPETADIVFSEDSYHSQFIDPFSWSNLIQLAKLTQNTCLFVGISLTDPNMRRLLDVAWRKNPDRTLSHYVVKKAPSTTNDDVLSEVSSLLEEQDANALGLNVVWVDEFDEIPGFLSEIAAEKEAS